jgi:hypothetical protein
MSAFDPKRTLASPNSLASEFDLTHEAHDVVEQVFFDDLPIRPASNSAEIHFE